VPNAPAYFAGTSARKETTLLALTYRKKNVIYLPFKKPHRKQSIKHCLPMQAGVKVLKFSSFVSDKEAD
jgi:hypothetical protein